MGPKKSVYEYDNFRDFLKDAFAAMKVNNKNFTYRYFSRIAGFKSPSVLKQVIEGEMKLSLSSIEKFTKAFKLNKEQSFFFHHLVLFNQAKTIDERQEHLAQMLSCRVFKKLYPLSGAQFNYYKNWYFIPIREMVALEDFHEDAEWIAKKIIPSITPQEAKKALDDMLELGLIKRNEEGRLEQVDANVSTGNEVALQAVSQFHRDMIKKGAEAIEVFPREVRDISAVTVGVSVETVKTIKEMVQKFRKEILEFALKTSNPDIVYQVNFQIFPVTESTKGGNKK
jgi:uncharacterized protein (TIGR02147 family)